MSTDTDDTTPRGGHPPTAYLVAYSATPSGDDALALGAALARSRGASLDVVIVLSDDSRSVIVPSDPSYDRYLESTAEGWLAEALSRIPADVVARGRLVRSGSPSEGLLEAADEFESSLIVVGAAHDGLLGRFALGPVANALVHSSSVPVGLAPRGYAEENPDSRPIERITAAVGARAGARILVETAIQFAEATTLPLRLVSLVALPDGGFSGRLARHADGDEDPVVSTRTAEHVAMLETSAAELAADHVVTVEVGSGRSVEEAVERLPWYDDEVVLVGSSRLARPSRLFLGSTANSMLRALPVPMIVVPRNSVTSTKG